MNDEKIILLLREEYILIDPPGIGDHVPLNIPTNFYFWNLDPQRREIMKFATALKYTRYNSGAHFLDSGGANGRAWQQPPNKAPLASFDKYDGRGIINVTRLLEDADIDPLHATLYRNMKNYPDVSWFEACEDAMRDMGYTQITRDNTYNSDNDFDQCFIYEIYDLADEDMRDGEDWIYSDTARVIFYIHTGADVRGGYSKPVMLRFPNADCVMPNTWTVGYWCEDDAVNEDGTYLAGYSDYPLGQLEDDGFQFVRVEDNGTVAVFSREDREYRFHPDYY